MGCDGKSCWDDRPDREPRQIEHGKALLDPHFAQGIALSALLGGGLHEVWGELALDGSDKADKRLCYRLSLTDPATSEQLFLWLSVFDSAGQPQLELVKTGVGLDDDESIASTLYRDIPSAANRIMARCGKPWCTGWGKRLPST